MADKTYGRAADHVKGIGDNLDEYQGRDVLLHAFTVEEGRPIRGKTSDFVQLTLSEVDSPSDKVEVHAWSSPLAKKLKDIPAGELPLLINFFKEKTSGGFQVWTFK